MEVPYPRNYACAWTQSFCSQASDSVLRLLSLPTKAVDSRALVNHAKGLNLTQAQELSQHFFPYYYNFILEGFNFTYIIQYCLNIFDIFQTFILIITFENLIYKFLYNVFMKVCECFTSYILVFCFTSYILVFCKFW